MTIVVTGGGSGGHITPILAVAAELKKQKPNIKIVYIGQRGDGLGDIPANDPNIDETFTVRAGKFRRYHGEGFKQLLDLPTMFKNIRDMGYILIGIWQSWRLIGAIKPNIVFSRGGFVSVPVAFGAKLHHVPYITHDSDPIPSLANRIIAPWAKLHAVALPKEIYPYKQNKTITTGIPLRAEYRPVTSELRSKYRRELDLPKEAPLLFVIGGGLGSERINQAVTEIVPHLLVEFSDLQVAHVVGRSNESKIKEYYNKKVSEAEQGRVRVFGYLDDVYRYSGAANVIVTRAGATNLAEFAVQGKACIVVPSSFLTAGHQLKNAQFLSDHHAAIVLDEADLQADSNRLAKPVSMLLHDPERQKQLASQLSTFAQPKAAHSLAMLLLEQAKKL